MSFENDISDLDLASFEMSFDFGLSLDHSLFRRFKETLSLLIIEHGRIHEEQDFLGCDDIDQEAWSLTDQFSDIIEKRVRSELGEELLLQVYEHLSEILDDELLQFEKDYERQHLVHLSAGSGESPS